jgi:hypothetical protein
MGLGVAGSVALGSAVLGAGTSLYGSSQAAGASKSAANLQEQNAIAAVNRAQPYISTGNDAAAQLDALNASGFTAGQPNYLALAQGAMPGQMTEAQLQQTPGYQFQLGQGLAATQNSAAARGLGVSGSALKGAATFATGLADSNYQNQFNNAQSQYADYMGLNTGQQGNATNLYNRLSGTATIGANASQGASTNAASSTNAAGGNISAAGQATAAGTTGAATAATSAANNYLTNNLLQQQIAQGGTTAGYGQVPSAAQYNAMATYNQGQLYGTPQ